MAILSTLVAAIDNSIAATQNASNDSTEGQNRRHLGASVVGKECARATWYSWRWATKVIFEGRILRLFNRGHEEEPRMVRWLQRVGCVVQTHDAETGNQLRFLGYKEHFGGSMDGLVTRVPGLEEHGWNLDSVFVAEFKTHGAKSFDNLVAVGVKAAKPEHYTQMQLYGHNIKADGVLYMAVCKNTDRLYIEVLPLDLAAYNNACNKARYIVDSVTPPARIPHASASLFACKYCDHRLTCHFGVTLEKNCRTCAFVKPVDGGRWLCNKYHQLIPEAAEKDGCGNWQEIQND